MDREQAKQEIKQRIRCEEFLKKSKGAGMYCCPFCGSGTGKNGTGALKVYENNTFKCFACDNHGDVITIYAEIEHLFFNEALTELANIAGITIDAYKPAQNAQRTAKTNNSKISPSDNTNAPQSATEPQNDFTEYYKECFNRLNTPDCIEYLNKRGISIENAQAYYLGFDPLADPAQSNHPAPRLIIPCSKSYYVARATSDNIKPQYKAINPKDSKAAIFNAQAIKDKENKYIFVAEGAIDALSIIEAGGTAIALNSASNVKELISMLAKEPTQATLILCGDNDERGQKAIKEISEGLKHLNISFIVRNICGACKDPNEALIKDKEKFIKEVSEAKRQASSRPDNTSYYIDNLFEQEVRAFKSDKFTGFDNLDKLTGGLYSGLYCIAATSSLGKTTFALQLADQIARAGHDVLYFSLEQSRLELVSKSISRYTAQQDINNALTSLEIRKAKGNRRQIDNFKAAVLNYKTDISDRLSIIEGGFKCDIEYINNYIGNYRAKTGTTPVIFIDYLQILQPLSEARKTDTKATVDAAITELAQLKRQYNLTIFVISSVNRMNYLTPIDFESLKESGNIEYTCDVVWGLQFNCINDPLFEAREKQSEKRAAIKKARAENPRKIQLCCLKNRYGKGTFDCNFEYYPAYDLFKEASKDISMQETNKPQNKNKYDNEFDEEFFRNAIRI